MSFFLGSSDDISSYIISFSAVAVTCIVKKSLINRMQKKIFLALVQVYYERAYQLYIKFDNFIYN